MEQKIFFYKKLDRAGEIVWYVGHLPCLQRTQVRFLAFHIVPRDCQEQSLNAEPEKNLSNSRCSSKTEEDAGGGGGWIRKKQLNRVSIKGPKIIRKDQKNNQPVFSNKLYTHTYIYSYILIVIVLNRIWWDQQLLLLQSSIN